jgi:hypothetical protein
LRGKVARGVSRVTEGGRRDSTQSKTILAPLRAVSELMKSFPPPADARPRIGDRGEGQGGGKQESLPRAIARPTLALPTLRYRFAGEGIVCIDTTVGNDAHPHPGRLLRQRRYGVTS